MTLLIFSCEGESKNNKVTNDKPEIYISESATTFKKLLFDKVKDMYDIVFFITHNDIVKDWGDNVVTVVKNNNLSKITFN